MSRLGRALNILRPKNIYRKIRKYYNITPKGDRILSKIREKIRELADEVME